jgi:hypothetical protein
MSNKQHSAHFLYSERWQRHERGNAECPKCQVLEDYPRRHKCRGLVHIAVKIEPGLGFIRVTEFEACDKCGYEETTPRVFTDQQ